MRYMWERSGEGKNWKASTVIEMQNVGAEQNHCRIGPEINPVSMKILFVFYIIW